MVFRLDYVKMEGSSKARAIEFGLRNR